MNGSPLVPQFAQLVTNGFASRMGPSLVNAIPLGAGHAFWMPLSGALSMVSRGASLVSAAKAGDAIDLGTVR